MTPPLFLKSSSSNQVCNRTRSPVFRTIPTTCNILIHQDQLPELLSIENNIRVNPQLIIIFQFSIPGNLIRSSQYIRSKTLASCKVNHGRIVLRDLDAPACTRSKQSCTKFSGRYMKPLYRKTEYNCFPLDHFFCLVKIPFGTLFFLWDQALLLLQ